MPAATVEEAPAIGGPTLKEKVADATEDAAYAARRAVKIARRRIQDARDTGEDVMYRVRREPFKAAGVAFGAGMVLGTLMGWWVTRSRTCT